MIPKKAKQWGEAGRWRVQEHFTDKKMVEKHTKLYQKAQTLKIRKRLI